MPRQQVEWGGRLDVYISWWARWDVLHMVVSSAHYDVAPARGFVLRLSCKSFYPTILWQVRPSPAHQENSRSLENACESFEKILQGI